LQLGLEIGLVDLHVVPDSDVDGLT